MCKKSLLRTFIVGPLVSLGLCTAVAGTAHAQDNDDDGPRELARSEVVGALAKFARMQNAMRIYHTAGVDAEALLDGANTFDLTPGQRPDEVELVKTSDPAKDSDPNARHVIFRIRESRSSSDQTFESFEKWDVTVEKGSDGQVHRLAKLDVKESMFNDVSYASLLQKNLPAFLAAYDAGRIAPIMEDDALVLMGHFYVNDVTKPVTSANHLAHVVVKGITPDERGTPTLRSASINYFGRSCHASVVTGSNFGPSSSFASHARSYSYACRNGFVDGDGRGGVTYWYPPEEQEKAPVPPGRSD